MLAVPFLRIERKCKKCGYVTDCESHLEDESKRPKVGDLSVCMNCTVITEFNESFDQDVLTTEQINALPVETKGQLLQVQRAIRAQNLPDLSMRKRD